MLNRVRVVTLLTTILVLFSVLQFSSSGVFFRQSEATNKLYI